MPVVSHQSDTTLRRSWRITWFACLSELRVRVVRSSAKAAFLELPPGMALMRSQVTCRGSRRLFMKRTNSSGPRTEPCGTPASRGRHDEYSRWYQTLPRLLASHLKMKCL